MRRQALWVVVGQLLVAVNGALICYAMWGALSSRSALIGGVIGAVATLAQVLTGLRRDGTGLVRGSTIKLVVTAILLVAAMRTIRRVLRPEAISPPYSVRSLQVGDIGWITHRQGVLYAQEKKTNEAREAFENYLKYGTHEDAASRKDAEDRLKTFKGR